MAASQEASGSEAAATPGPRAVDRGAGPPQASEPATDPASMQRRRQRIASLLEANLAYRGIIDGGAPKLAKAKFAGPFEIGGSIFHARETVYCASAEIVPPIPWPLHQIRTAVVRSHRGEDPSQ
jgi:hypothetical protein